MTRSRSAVPLCVALACAGCGGSDDTRGAVGPRPRVPEGIDAGSTAPMATPPLQWTWVPFGGATCRDGSTAGIVVNAQPNSESLVIYLEGGGSCWNELECTFNPATFTPPASFDGWGTTGIFDRNNPSNPVGGWTMVYVPYCTGDLHAGNNPGFDPGVGPQQFVGYANLEKFLDRLVATYPKVNTVLHTGFSAGGYGALFTAELVARKFGSKADVVVIADSSPSMSNEFLPGCIQHQKWTTFGFDKTFLRDCGADCADPDAYLVDYPAHLVKTYPSRRFAVIEAIADATISGKFGYTASDCNVAVTQAPPPMDPTTFEAGLLDYRARMTALVPDGGTPNFGTFYLPGAQHGWLTIGDSLYLANVSGVALVDWVAGIVGGSAPTNVGP